MTEFQPQRHGLLVSGQVCLRGVGKLNQEDIVKTAVEFTENSPQNRVAKEIALREDVVGLKLFDAPIFAFGAADAANFLVLKKSDVIGGHFLLPEEWLPEAKGVLSFFLPFSERVKKANAANLSEPSIEWLHARIEGQAFLEELCRLLQGKMLKEGYKSVTPAIDERFRSQKFSSNWSERHIAFVLGLGTFGLSQGLITKKGVAGRFGSIITEMKFTNQAKDYTQAYEYCTKCGICAENCPVKAISSQTGKDHRSCGAFLDKTREKHKPRYGCGKCQVNVPCESCIP